MIVSPLCTAASVLILRVLIWTLHAALLTNVELAELHAAGSEPGVLTSCTMSKNTIPSLVTRGRTFKMTPVSMYCTEE